MAYILEDAQTQRPATVNRTATHFVFPGTVKAPNLIEAFRFGCSLISLLCVLVTLQYRLKKVNVKAIQLQA